MAAQEEDVEIASVISQILSDILSFSADQHESLLLNNHPCNQTLYEPMSCNFPQPTNSNVQQEGDGARINPESAKNDNIGDSKTTEENSRNAKPYQTCTVKEILTEILDCTVIRRPSLQLPSTSATSDRNILTSTSPPPEYMSNPRLIPKQIYIIRRDSSDSTTSRMQCTVKEVLSELMDYTVFKKTERQLNDFGYSEPGTSRTRSENFERGENIRGYQIYRYSPSI